MPFFSVVIPIYNRANLIGATINSVLGQTFGDYELIIVNDGSTDNSEEVIQSIARENTKVKYFWQENKERGAARNYGFKNASGTYVTFLDSDDLMHPDHLAILFKKIEEQHYPNFIATKFILKRGSKRTTTIIQSLSEGYYDIHFVLSGSHFGCNFSVRKGNPGLCLFVEDRKYSIMEDWMFILYNLQRDKIYIIDANTITMNDHDERSMRGNHNEIICKRILSTQWVENNTDLSARQLKVLWGNTYYFCAIHSYLGGRRRETFGFLFKSIRLQGMSFSKRILVIRSVFGFSMIQKMK